MRGESMSQIVTRNEIHSKLTSIFRSVFDDDTITLSPATNADDIEEWDSLNQIKIILACEQVFKVKLNARKVNTFANVGQMIDYLDGVLKEEKQI
jgi:acyl carrier protein